MEPRTRAFLTSVVAALALLIALDRGYGAYARKHFIPSATLRQAEAQGDGCVVTLGDSRMAAAIDAAALAEALKAGGSPRCVAPLAIGAVPISGSAMAIRRFVADGRRPGVVVLGESDGTLLPELAPTDPSELVGNRAAELDWSRASDVGIYYPSFPLGELDRGLRFSLARTNALETFESATWVKVNALQRRLTGTEHAEPHNRFGAVSDMLTLLGGFRDAALRSLAHFDRGDGAGDWATSPWFDMLRAIVRRSGARLLVIEVPMRSSYRAEVLARPEAARYRQWLAQELARTGDLFLDFSAPKSVSDPDFGDGLHLDDASAARFSSELGASLAPVLAHLSAPPAPGP
jgi:hypothetical protein